MELKRFAEKWCHEDYVPEPVKAAALTAVEKTLGINFPADYRTQVLAVGLPSPTLALLSAIVDLELDIRDLAYLATPSHMWEETLGSQAAGLPDNLLIIGYDCAGNSFCFDINDLSGIQKTGTPIYIWDHDFGDTEFVADSFAQWIEGYLGEWSKNLTAKDF